ncbi:hypothetical protein [Thioclava electrotropha]|uniref:hypothetical protein n=1 Tax=Thioclava electrotropha TaxID=1549850 RepID=UPI0023A812BE|nr:hypothetical protein [Thioclava electrotropha]
MFKGIRDLEGSAFFFFFSPWETAGYDDPMFRAFCEACADARRQHPNITVATCYTFLSIVAGMTGDGITNEEIVDLTGLEYNQVAPQVEALSSGRWKKEGLGFLERRDVENCRSRKIFVTKAGEEFARIFARPAGADAPHGDMVKHLLRSPLPALRAVRSRFPTLRLGTLTVFLFLGARQREFGFNGTPAHALADELGIPNFPRHLAVLGEGPKGGKGLGLIELRVSREDRRVKLPEVTEKGHRFLTEIASAVVGKEIELPRKVEPQKLEDLDSPDDISGLDDEDFIWLPPDED